MSVIKIHKSGHFLPYISYPKGFGKAILVFFPKHTCRNTGILYRVQAWKWNRKGRREKQTSEIWERSPKKSYFLWHVGWRSYLLWFSLQHHSKAWPEIMSLSSSLETMQILKIIIKNQFRWVQQMKGCSDPRASDTTNWQSQFSRDEGNTLLCPVASMR